jgi:hypothetical protein
MDREPSVTQHAAKRVRRRIGHSRAEEQFQEALKHGQPAEAFAGYFRGFLDAHRMKFGGDCVVYKGMIYWYNSKSNILITLYGVPVKFHKYLKKGAGATRVSSKVPDTAKDANKGTEALEELTECNGKFELGADEQGTQQNTS